MVGMTMRMTMTNVFLKPHLIPLPSKFLFPNTFKPSFAHTLTTTFLIPHFSTTPLSYGPSLRKGTIPSHSQSQSQSSQNQNDAVLREEAFTRVFLLAALRVPSAECSALESQLRGHLLNWPRVRNIARVPGDDLDPTLAPLLPQPISGDHEFENEEERTLVSVQRRIHGKADGDGDVLSPVLYRDKLARTFNSRGFVKFRNLAKISRPNRNKKRKKRKEGMEVEDGRRVGQNGFAVVEVVEEEEEDSVGMRKLLGEEFVSSKWRGSTRLLLLDERFAGRGVEELPEAIKAVLKEYAEKNTMLTLELVRCKLTLFYDYWQMTEVLETLLPEGMIVPSAFESVGHIAHLNLREEHLPYKRLIAKVVLDKNRPKIQSVVNKIDSIQNEYRTMQLEVLAGNHSLVTTVVENGLRFQVDLATVYWSSRLGTERQRLLSGFTRKDVVCDVFSGVGPLAISAARIVKRVFANDLNPYAVEYLERNSVLNKLEKKIKVFNMDGRRFIKSLYASDVSQSITQVVMNLPSEAAEFLDAFRGIYKNRPKDGEYTFPMIHVYGFSKARDPEFDFHERIRIALVEVAVNVDVRRLTGSTASLFSLILGVAPCFLTCLLSDLN
ncbi:tRNA (guanine(37)-N1)-methyltransferase 1 isoform X2 [Vigna radiata var. radiata]|uniref:tRNA (guanine(37)-N1)-methyltransferase n=1 Tax=Vigna radiata var. radiata TaxID=3916 RepID=A0A3Q0EQG9_VIGRR|nr:tRNA (guanine(37)-N1)-methyltransferase 1 isoform X2 [Vigna radiata var. radiata]XP_022632675.1 tRNA (guanine(37)-N1)-methyltransferase 1 isoform X2 [Vigna radiata var. radiata]XP_022632676.1 tRNA (guanine(37)-N1)-methyltransferase 1 isoform X2 [Vigna radiata var. radiata]